MNMNEITSALEAMTRLSRYLMENVSKSEQLTDNQIAACRALLRSWQPGEALEEKDCRRYGDKAYRCRQAHTAQAGWEPDKVPNLWAVIDVAHAGTAEDPIPASRGMDYEYSKYYLDPEDGKTYLCRREGAVEGETVNLQYLPHEVVGQYFEEAAS